MTSSANTPGATGPEPPAPAGPTGAHGRTEGGPASGDGPTSGVGPASEVAPTSAVGPTSGDGPASAVGPASGDGPTSAVGPTSGVGPASGDAAAVGPAYGGAADTGVVDSVGAGHPAAGEIVAALASEHRKIERVLAEVAGLAEAGAAEELRLRWGGVVREILEHEAAERRVVLPAVEAAAPDQVAAVRREQAGLMDLLGPYDALNPEVSAADVRSAVEAVLAYERSVGQVIVPLLAQLPADERTRLGEDLRQVMG